MNYDMKTSTEHMQPRQSTYSWPLEGSRFWFSRALRESEHRTACLTLTKQIQVQGGYCGAKSEQMFKLLTGTAMPATPLKAKLPTAVSLAAASLPAAKTPPSVHALHVLINVKLQIP